MRDNLWLPSQYFHVQCPILQASRDLTFQKKSLRGHTGPLFLQLLGAFKFGNSPYEAIQNLFPLHFHARTSITLASITLIFEEEKTGGTILGIPSQHVHVQTPILQPTRA